MDRHEVITDLKKYFDIRELVCRHVHTKFGDKSWMFLDDKLLHILLILRKEIYKAPVIINNWHTGGSYNERGLRCNICNLVKSKTLNGQIYMSAHGNGSGIDHNVIGLTANQCRNLIKSNEHLIPFPVRIEKDVSWVHIDVYDSADGKKITEFSK